MTVSFSVAVVVSVTVTVKIWLVSMGTTRRGPLDVAEETGVGVPSGDGDVLDASEGIVAAGSGGAALEANDGEGELDGVSELAAGRCVGYMKPPPPLGLLAAEVGCAAVGALDGDIEADGAVPEVLGAADSDASPTVDVMMTAGGGESELVGNAGGIEELGDSLATVVADGCADG